MTISITNTQTGIVTHNEPNSNGNPANWITEPRYAGCLTNLYTPVSQTVCPLLV